MNVEQNSFSGVMFTVGLDRNLNTTTSIGVAVKTFGTES